MIKLDETIYSGIISGYGPVIATLKFFDNNQNCLSNIKTTLVNIQNNICIIKWISKKLLILTILT